MAVRLHTRIFPPSSSQATHLHVYIASTNAMSVPFLLFIFLLCVDRDTIAVLLDNPLLTEASQPFFKLWVLWLLLRGKRSLNACRNSNKKGKEKSSISLTSSLQIIGSQTDLTSLPKKSLNKTLIKSIPKQATTLAQCSR